MNPNRFHISVDHAEQSSLPPDNARSATQRAPKRPGDDGLSLDAEAWFDSLPPHARPNNLARHWPRICNRIVERWEFPDLMIPYLDDLLMDNRGGRQGFTMTLVVEIVSLKEHYLATIPATSADVWDRVIASRIF